MLKINGGWLPLHRVRFIDDAMHVSTDDERESYTTSQEAIDAIMPKTRKPSWFKRLFGGIKLMRQPMSLAFMAWRMIRMAV